MAVATNGPKLAQENLAILNLQQTFRNLNNLSPF